MRITKLGCCLAVVLALMASDSHAALVTSLTLHQYEYTVSPTESVEIWATFSLAPNSDPLVFDTATYYPWGLDPDFIPTHGNLGFPGDTGTPFASYTNLSTSVFRMCLIRIGSGCTFSEYDFDFSHNYWINLDAGSFAPGDSVDILLYTFTPHNGFVSPGLYTMDNLGIGFAVRGRDADSNFIMAFPHVAETCPDRLPECRLSINVVPLPPAILLFASAIIVLFQRRIVR